MSAINKIPTILLHDTGNERAQIESFTGTNKLRFNLKLTPNAAGKLVKMRVLQQMQISNFGGTYWLDVPMVEENES